MIKFSQHSTSLYAFFCALVIYALFGSPTPDHPGLVELLIGGLLVLAVGFTGVRAIFQMREDDPLWRRGAQFLFLYGLSVPLIGGVLQGHGLGLITRDILPFLFMLLPLFFQPLFNRETYFSRILIMGLVVIGVSFAVRAVPHIYGVFSSFFIFETHELHYFANMPTVLFAGLFCWGMSIKYLMQARQDNKKQILFSIVFFVLSSLILVPLLLTFQRASLGLFMLYALAVLVYALTRTPIRVIFFMILLAVIVQNFGDVLGFFAQGLIYKTEIVGANMRLEELSAIWVQVSENIFTLLFGQGWGATFSSPATDGAYVNFTHSLLSAMLWKSGFVGLTLTGLYLFGLFKLLVAKFFEHPILAGALICPLLIDIFLYASYKSLDFGLLLLLIPAALSLPAQPSKKEGHA